MLGFSFAVVALSFAIIAHSEEAPNPARDILVTFDNDSARSASASLGAPYQHRKRYSIGRKVRRDAAAVADDYALTSIEHWPIRSLSVYCFVYRVAEGTDRQEIIDRLNADARVESAQPLQSFETSTSPAEVYDDTYANLQYGLDVLGIAAAHRTTQGADVRIAIIDSNVDEQHEDLRGRIDRVKEFVSRDSPVDEDHGTAVASVIGARSNNAAGIVGIAPKATLELYVSCWSGGKQGSAVCDSFSLSKALDSMLEDPPQVLNLSLKGPYDPLLERLIEKAVDVGVIVVAAGPVGSDSLTSFPSGLQNVIGVGTSPTDGPRESAADGTLFAPGDRILVAVPTNQYDFRSGSSIAAAHVSGVVALILAVAPDLSPDDIASILWRSQAGGSDSSISINACNALNLTGSEQRCEDEAQR